LGLTYIPRTSTDIPELLECQEFPKRNPNLDVGREEEVPERKDFLVAAAGLEPMAQSKSAMTDREDSETKSAGGPARTI
jgi:hypothetical protein